MLVGAYIYLHAAGSVHILTCCWERTYTYILLEAYIYLHAAGSVHILTYCWERTCTYMLLGAYIYLHTAGSVHILTYCWERTYTYMLLVAYIYLHAAWSVRILTCCSELASEINCSHSEKLRFKNNCTPFFGRGGVYKKMFFKLRHCRIFVFDFRELI